MTAYRRSLPTALFSAVLSTPPSMLTRLSGGPVIADGEPLQPATRTMLILRERLGLAKDSHDVAERRDSMRDASALAMPVARRVTVSSGTLPGAVDDRPVRIYRPWDRGPGPAPVILYLHGGGWVVGDLDTHDAVCREVAVAGGLTVVAVDYRLAPEFPFPAGLEDVVAAFRHLRDHPLAGEQPGAVALMGDSAGGNLSAAAALLLRDSGEVGPAALGLMYPATDLTLASPSIDRFGDGYFLTRDDMEWYRGHYAPDPDQWMDPLVSPMFADDLSGLPPTWVWTAGFDPLRDEGATFADRLSAAGVSVHHHCFGDQIHGFASMGFLPGGLTRLQAMATQLRQLLDVPPS